MGQETKEKKIQEVNNDIPPFKPKKRKKKKWLFIGLIFIILVAAGFIFRQPLINFLRTIPVVGKLVPSTADSESALSKEELLIQYEKQKQDILTLEEKINVLEETNKDLQTRNVTLKEYENKYEDFLKQKEAWDQSIAENNPELFIEQFEKIYPETAAELYKTLKGEAINTKEQQALAKAVGEMDEDQAAKALEVLLTTDSELVQTIMKEMKDEKKSLILSSMTSQGAATVIKLISPEINNQQN